MPFPYQDSIIYTTEVGGSEYDIEIGYNMGVDWDHNDRMVDVVEAWGVVKVCGKPTPLPTYWRACLDEERVMDAIMEQEMA